MPIFMNFSLSSGGDRPQESFAVPIVTPGEVQLFSEGSPVTQEQVDRAAASLATFIEQLPEDEQVVITHVLRQATEAATST
jgi:hypothetical protein